MLLALVHLTPRMHAPLDEPQHRLERAIAGQSFHQALGTIAAHLGELDQTPLRVLPGEEDHEPVLQNHPNQLGIHFT